VPYAAAPQDPSRLWDEGCRSKCCWQ
jgi:hypothetical protein